MGLIPTDLFFLHKKKKRKKSQGFSELLKETDPLSLEHLSVLTPAPCPLGKQAGWRCGIPGFCSQACQPDGSASAAAGTGGLSQPALVLRPSRPLSSGWVSAPCRHHCRQC